MVVRHGYRPAQWSRDGSAGRHAIGQDESHAHHGGSRCADRRAGSGRRAKRDRYAGARTQCGNGVPAVHQLLVLEGVRQHRFTDEVAWRQEYRPARQGTGRKAPYRDVPRSLPGGPFRWTATACGTGPRAGQSGTFDAAGRTAGQSGLQTARRTARRVDRAVRCRRLDRDLCDDRTKRSAVAGRLHGRAGSRRIAAIRPDRRRLLQTQIAARGSRLQ